MSNFSLSLCLLCFSLIRLNRLSSHDVAALLRASVVVFMLDFIRVIRMVVLFLHELHSAHLKPINSGHIYLWQVMRLVARVDILSDRLRLLEDEFFSFIIRLMTVNSTGWFIETILHHVLVASLLTRSVPIRD